MQRRAPERLRLHEDTAQLAFLEGALLLDSAQKLLVVHQFTESMMARPMAANPPLAAMQAPSMNIFGA